MNDLGRSTGYAGVDRSSNHCRSPACKTIVIFSCHNVCDATLQNRTSEFSHYITSLLGLVRSTSLDGQNSYAIPGGRPIKRYPSYNGLITRDDAGWSIKSIAGSCISRQQLYSPL
jgi:hypothetical protein